MIRIPFLLLFVLLMASCGYADKDFYLTETHEAFFKPYRKGDSLFFESSTNVVDTIVIQSIDTSLKRKTGYLMALPAHLDISITIKNIPIYTKKISDEKGKIIKEDTIASILLYIRREPQKKKTTFSFGLKNFNAYFDIEKATPNAETIEINGMKLSNYYSIYNQPLTKSTTYTTDIEQIFWTKKDGLVAYKTYGNMYWVRIRHPL